MAEQPQTEIITEYGAVAQKLLPRDIDECTEYDVIVVGSGMGGGVVASALADENKRVLVLEAGSLLFPTHVGNLPRRILIGKFQKHIWSVWDKWKVTNYNLPKGGEYCGAQAFNLGGRSMFWGASIPKLAQWELDAWPKAIQKYLIKGDGYDKASQTFNADIPELKPFHAAASNIISKALGKDWEVAPAPVAVEYSGATEWSVPAGIFSTSDLLIEDAMVGTHDMPGRHPLCVNLNHQVWNINFDGDRATGVNCFDLLDRKQRTYHAKTIVLAAGTLESAKIALQSNIKNPLIGRGITDHPIYYRHFTIPPEFAGFPAEGRAEPQSTKLLVRHQSATLKDHSFDVIIELGAQFNQGRFVDHDHIVDELAVRKGHMLCEIVFQFYAPLMDCNTVTLGGWNKPVDVYMEKYCLPPALLEEARKVAKVVFESLGAAPVIYEGPLLAGDGLAHLELAKLGGVAHEVGTLRMPVNGQKGVVDENLKFEGYRNLFACDNSVFPCSPAGNPSLTLVALARRCAKEVAKVVRYMDHPEEIPVPTPEPIETPSKIIQIPEDGAKDPITISAPAPSSSESSIEEDLVSTTTGTAFVKGTALVEGVFAVSDSSVEETKSFGEVISIGKTASVEEITSVQKITSVEEVTSFEQITSSEKITSVIESTSVAADAA